MTDSADRLPRSSASGDFASAVDIKMWLSEHFARETDAQALLRVALATVGQFLGASRVAYGELDAELTTITTAIDWTNGVPSLVGQRPFDALSELAAHYRSGQPMIVTDIGAGNVSAEQRTDFARNGVAALIAVPLIDDGRLVGILQATHDRPHDWHPEAVLLLAQTGARLWGALQHLRTLEQLRESEEQFRTLAENMPALCWLAHADGQAYWGNRRWTEFFAGTGIMDSALSWTVHPADVARATEIWTRGIALGEACELQVRLRGVDGAYRPFFSTANPIRDAQGQVARWCGVLVDLSEHLAQDRRQAFLRRFSDATRDETDAAQILATVSELLIDEMAIGQVTYSEVTADDSVFNVFLARPGRRFDEVPASFVFAKGFEPLLDHYRRGRTLVVSSYDDQMPQLTKPVLAARRKVAMCASINVPLVKDGRLMAMLSATNPTPRAWSGDEVALLEELSERLFSSVSRARAEAALADRERSQAFLIAWSDAVRHESDPRAMLALTLDAIGRHLGVSRANYAEASDAGDALCVLQEWKQGVTSVIGQSFPLAALGERILADHLSGAPVRVDNVASDPRFDEGNRPMYDAIGVSAFLSVPLVRQNEIIGVLSVQQDSPRSWSDREAALLRELADRTWAVLERALSEQRLADSEAQLAAFMENAPVAMHMKDADGRYVRINPEFARAIGRSRDDIQGAHPSELFPPDIARTVDRIERRALAGEVASAELDVPVGDGTGSVLATVFPIAGSGGAARTAGFTLDLTERKRAEAALARSREALFQTEKLSALGSLLAGVSHELNNPLSIVVAQAVMMERQAHGGDMAERAQKIRKAAERCARIVQTFLAMARQKRPERKAVDLNAIATAALDLAGYGLKSDGIIVERELSASLPLIAADADQLHQIVINLIINAQQALSGQGDDDRRLTVRTATGPTPGTLILDVSDSGPGIPADDQRRVFEPFFTTKPQGEGTGIGLSFSQGLAEAHGGRLDLVASPRGATFRLTLPLTAGAASEESGDLVDAAARPLPRRALVVDDEPELAEALADFLSLEGFACDTATGGVPAQAYLKHGQYDLVVSDIRMPDCDGPQLHGWIERHRPDLVDRTAFVTGDTLGTTAARFLDAVRRPVLEKPFTPESVARFLAQMERL